MVAPSERMPDIRTGANPRRRVSCLYILYVECLAGGPGFEPRLTGSEPVVLPLNYPPISILAGASAGRCGWI
jgi:hypothetical protein